ncbi:MAG: hypothetical protein JW888_16960 [Pirellulales bacterium]|nr:hypothetical protein [Pirellulales bacterium]
MRETPVRIKDLSGQSSSIFFPYNTDAPLYHWPIITVGLIAINILVFITLMQAPDVEAALYPWILEYSVGLKPVQWISANFIHLGIEYLVGNMLAL